jgi:hypothetical protein
LLAVVVLGAAGPTHASGPRAHTAAVCADFPNQAAAQRAHNTRDPDHDGVYCESLPCPCAGPGAPHHTPRHKAKPHARPCIQVPYPVVIRLRRTRYPHIVAHIVRSWRRGYPKVLRIHRAGASIRRRRLLAHMATRAGYDRDEAPAAVLRLTIRADVAYVPARENRAAGASLGDQLRPYCNGQSVRYSFR